jgi:hypothetical protein
MGNTHLVIINDVCEMICWEEVRLQKYRVSGERCVSILNRSEYEVVGRVTFGQLPVLLAI